jgi:hypothetical protein
MSRRRHPAGVDPARLRARLLVGPEQDCEPFVTDSAIQRGDGLSPEQVAVAPISQEQADYAAEVDLFEGFGLRAVSYSGAENLVASDRRCARGRGARYGVGFESQAAIPESFSAGRSSLAVSPSIRIRLCASRFRQRRGPACCAAQKRAHGGNVRRIQAAPAPAMMRRPGDRRQTPTGRGVGRGQGMTANSCLPEGGARTRTGTPCKAPAMPLGEAGCMGRQ